MSFLRGIIGKGEEGRENQGEEYERQRASIEKLVGGLQHASLLEDRRSAALAVKSMSKHYPVAVGLFGLSQLLTGFKRDSEDEEMSKIIMEVFIALCNCEEMGKEFSEIVAKDRDVFVVFLEWLERGRDSLKYEILQLLGIFAQLIPNRLSELLLSGVSLLVAILRDASVNELIANEALLLLERLGHVGTLELKRMIVFEGIFEVLLEAPGTSEGVDHEWIIKIRIVECLLVDNISSQKYFLESSGLRLILRLFDSAIELGNTQELVPLMGIVNTVLMNHSSPRLGEIQNQLMKLGFVGRFQTLANHENYIVRLVSVFTFANLFYKNVQLKMLISRLFVTEGVDSKPIPLILSLVTMLYDSDSDTRVDFDELGIIQSEYSQVNPPTTVADAVLYFLQVFLDENQNDQLAIAATLKPPGEDAISVGSLLLRWLLTFQSLKREYPNIWFSAVVLSYVLRGNSQVKQLALAHCMDDGELLIERLIVNLNDTLRIPEQWGCQTSIGYLLLLIMWCESFPELGQYLLNDGGIVQLLIEVIGSSSNSHPLIQGLGAYLFGQLVSLAEKAALLGKVAFSEDDLKKIVKNRIGTDVFVDRISKLKVFCSRVPQGGAWFDESASRLILKNIDEITNVSIGMTPKQVEVSIEANIEFDAAAEIDRLTKLVVLYQSQLLEMEKDHEDLLTMLAVYDTELKQLRQQLQIPDQDAYIVGGMDGNITDYNPSEVDLRGAFSPGSNVSDLLNEASSVEHRFGIEMGDVVEVVDPLIDGQLPVGALYQSPTKTGVVAKVLDLHLPAPSSTCHDV